MKKTLSQCKHLVASRSGHQNWTTLLKYQNGATLKDYYLQALEMFAQQFAEFHQ
jgi:hypothetical protein